MSKRILVVEDQEYLRDLLRDLRLYSHRGRRWRGAKARSEHPDLILMDIKMPVIDGYEATSRIDEGRRGKRRAAGCNHYVTKTYSPMQLLALLEVSSAISRESAWSGLCVCFRDAMLMK